MFANVYNIIAKQIDNVTGALISGTYYTANSILFNGVSYTIIGLIAMFWLMQRLKDNFPKEQLWKAFVWICITAFVFGAFGSITAYKELLTWFNIPSYWANDIASSVSGGGNIATKFGNIWDILIQKRNDYWNYATKTECDNCYTYAEGSLFVPDGVTTFVNALKDALVFLNTLTYHIFILLIIIMLLAVAAMTLVAQFIARVLLSISPMVVPLIIIPQTRAYFFSWLKLYISVSLYPALALLILGIAYKSVKLIDGKSGRELWDNPFANVFPSLCMTLIAIYTITKIPNWIQQIMGTSDGGMGASAGGAMMALATSGASKIGGKAWSGTKKAGGATLRTGGNVISKISDNASASNRIGIRALGGAGHLLGALARKAGGGNFRRSNPQDTLKDMQNNMDKLKQTIK